MTEQQFAKISFEFFPPKTDEGLTELTATAGKFLAYDPDFFSVTFGAGGSTQSLTMETVEMLKANYPTHIAPHISCIGTKKPDILKLLTQYQEKGFQDLVVLRGDLLDKQKQTQGDFQHADELVKFIRDKTDQHFKISVAAYPEHHPESEHPHADLQHFSNKVKAGADQAITQYFFNPDAYFYFVDSCHENGVDTPIIPGIMPITNYKQLARFSDTCGAEIPMWIRKKLAYFDSRDDEIGLREFGEQVITMLCETLLNNGAPGLHFYTLNRFDSTHNILQNLMLSAIDPHLPVGD